MEIGGLGAGLRAIFAKTRTIPLSDKLADSQKLPKGSTITEAKPAKGDTEINVKYDCGDKKGLEATYTLPMGQQSTNLRVNEDGTGVTYSCADGNKNISLVQ